MKFLALLAALLIEQVYPLRAGNPFHRGFLRYAALIERHFNGGLYREGVIAWLLVVFAAAAAVFAVSLLLAQLSLLLAWAWSVSVLYLTMGFRQFSHYFTDIARALQEGKIDQAREILGRWRGRSAAGLSESEIARVSIELGLAGAHRHVFGPIAGFVVLGAAGAVLYRAALMVSEQWAGRSDPESGEFGRFAQRFFRWLDWIPSRLTAASFAVVGNFEDAVYCWRTQAAAWDAPSQEIVIASGGGAIGVRLGSALQESGTPAFRPETGMGEEADVGHMQSTVGLIWRALVLWMFLLFVVSVAYALG